ncbi:MAG: tubulin-like doman-containing protein [Candidatus Methylumidiphilus sp.]
MSNHYFIGIGGTGGNILRALRKTMYLRDNEIKALGNNLRVGFLYIDSNRPELYEMGKEWTVLGKSVDLAQSDKLLIKEGNLTAVLLDIGKYPSISPWIGKLEQIKPMLGAEGGTPGAQQRRRFGRFLFATNVGQFRDMVQNKVRVLTQGVRAECTFHLFGTLGGGTGSGSLVDAAVQIRTLYPNSDDYKINAYVLITDDDGDQSDVGFFYPNQYAALKDLNALMVVDQWNIHNLGSPQGEPYVSDKDRQVLHSCILVSNQNAIKHSISKDQQERTVAEWVLQVVVAQAGQSLPAAFTKSLTMEDIAASTPGEPELFRERSFRFASIGIFRWSVPEEQIREYLSSKVAILVADQLVYNNWDDRRGYVDQRKNSNGEEFLKANPLQSFGIDKNQLLLNGPTSFETEWANKLRRGLPTDLEKMVDPLAYLEQRAKDFYNVEFRDTGVDQFFSGLEREASNRAKQIAETIGFRLRESWVGGSVGLIDIFEVVNQYTNQLDGQISLLGTELAELDDRVSRSDNTLSARKNEWKKIGSASAFFGKKGKLIEAQQDNLVEKYVSQTKSKGLRYCNQLLGHLKTDLIELNSVIAKLQGEIGKKRNDLIRIHQNQEQAFRSQVQEQTTSEQNSGGMDFMNKTELDRGLLEDHLQKIAKSQSQLSQLAAQCRNIQADDFHELHHQGINRLFEVIEQQSAETVTTAHNANVTDRMSLGGILGMNLLERIFKRFSNNPDALQYEVASFVNKAIATLYLDNTAPQPGNLAGISMPRMPQKSLLVLLPQPPLEADSTNRSNHERFIREFKAAVRDSVTGGGINIDFAESNSPREITIIALNYWMAARFAACVANLKKRYDEKMSGSGDSASAYRYFCHLHDTYGATPDLFPAPGDALRLSFKANIRIGQHLNLIQTEEDSGAIFLVKEKDGLPDPEEIAASEKALEALTDVKMAKYRAAIRQGAAPYPVEDFKTLLDAERDGLRKRLQECGNKPTNPDYRAALATYEALKKAVEEIKGAI